MLRVLAATVAAALGFIPTARAEEIKPILPFNGKDLTGWKAKDEARNKWQVCAVAVNPKVPNELTGGVNNSPDGTGAALAALAPGGTDIYTAERFADGVYEIEFMIPKGSNSGIYLMGEYEVQIIDSTGKEKLGPGDLGGIYQNAAPVVNAGKKPGEWQTFVIDFRAPRFDGTKKIENAKFVKVTLNGQVIHENVEMKKGPTPGGLTGKEAPTGPLMFQGDHGAVAFRTIKIVPKK